MTSLSCIRKILKSDEKTLEKIHKQCFLDCWSAESFVQMLDNESFFGFIVERCSQAADISNIACGFILCKIICGEIEIITYCILPEFRKLGLGRKLLQYLEEYAKTKSVNEIFLDVSVDNNSAINLYKSCGYVEFSKRKRYYKTKNGDYLDAYIMQKKLSSKIDNHQ